MPLTNAERQKQHGERLKVAGSAAVGLTAEQRADRDAVMADPLYPVPPADRHGRMPRFMEWDRYEWAAAPKPLIDHFGMRSAWEGWKAEYDAVEACQRDLHALTKARVDEYGEPASLIIREHGHIALYRAHDADPTLGMSKPRKRIT